MSDKRAVEGAGPYDADGRFPVGEGLAPPAVPAPVSDKRAVEGAGPYGVDARFPVGSDPKIAPPTRADVRHTGG